MRKKNRREAIIWSKLSDHRYQSNLKRKDKSYDPNKVIGVKNVLSYKQIEAPEHISIYEFSGRDNNLSLCTQFIKNIEREVPNNNCIIDFSSTKKFSAAAVLLVYACIEKSKEESKYKTFIKMPAKAKLVRAAIKQSNILKLIKGQDIKYSFSNYTQLPVISGIGRESIEEVIDHIQEKIYENDMSPEVEHKYGDAVTETINNVRLHAYPTKDDKDKRWWLLCHVIDDQLYLAIYDSGVGIPKTVVKKKWFLASAKHFYPKYYDLIKDIPEFDEDKGLIRTLTDHQLIYLSMKGDVTGTKKSKHGQGSKSIKALVDQTEDGKLWVYSNEGFYSFESDQEEPSISRLPSKIPGTLVQWNIKIV